MAIGGIGGALLAGLEGYSQARQREQQDQRLRADIEMRQRLLQAELDQQQQQRRDIGAGYGALGGLSGLGGGLAPSMAPPQGPPMQPMGGGPPDTVMPPSPTGYAVPRQNVGFGGGDQGALARDNWEVQHNNFGGLRRPGIVAGPKAGGFQSFDTPEAGVGAISRQLDRYASGATTGRPLTTIKDIVSTWAPASDRNPTNALIQRASTILGVPPDQPLDLQDPNVKAKLIEAIIRNEQGGRLPAQVTSDMMMRIAQGSLTPEAKQAVVQVQQSIPPQVQGRMGAIQLRDAIEKAMPGASNEDKGAAFIAAQQMLAPDQKLQLEQAIRQHDWDFREREFQERQRHDRATEAATESKGWKTFDITMPDGTKRPARIQESTGKVEMIQLPEGATGITKVGTPSQSQLAPETMKTMAEGIANYQLPPLSGWALRSPNGQALMAEVMKINPQYDATTYGGKASGARITWNRGKSLEMAGNVVEEVIPLALETSEKLDRTEFPTINSMVIAAEKGTGSVEVVQFLDQLNSLKYAYARALNPTGQARVEDLKRFDDILSTSWSKGQIKGALEQMRKTIAAEKRGVAKATGGSQGAPTDSGGGLPTVRSQKELDDLAPDSDYLGPDGKTYHKPKAQ